MIRRPLTLPTVPQGVDLPAQFQHPQFMDIHPAEMPQQQQQGGGLGSALGTGLGAVLSKMKPNTATADSETDAPMGGGGLMDLLKRKRQFPGIGGVGGGDVA